MVQPSATCAEGSPVQAPSSVAAPGDSAAAGEPEAKAPSSNRTSCSPTPIVDESDPKMIQPSATCAEASLIIIQARPSVAAPGDSAAGGEPEAKAPSAAVGRWKTAFSQLTQLDVKRLKLIERGQAAQPPLSQEVLPQTRGAVVSAAEHRATTIRQMRSLAELVRWFLEEFTIIDDWTSERVVWDNVNMYSICTHLVKTLTAAEFLCSWVELVARGPQEPIWFISHAWSTLFKDTVDMLDWHLECKDLSPDTPYWFCTLAMNQHDLGSLTGSVDQTPFWKAISNNTCEGIVQTMDENCTPHKRSWCILEVIAVHSVVCLYMAVDRYGSWLAVCL